MTYGDFEHYRMPSGSEVWYRDSQHAYFGRVERRGKKWVGPQDARLPSPSAVAGVLDLGKAEGLMRWAAKHPDALGERGKRAKEGTAVHEKVLQALAADGGIPSLADVGEDERGYAQGVLAWWHARKPSPLHSEAVVYSERHRFAGRLDLIAEIEDETWLIDLKTSKFIGVAAHVQLAGYAIAAAHSGYPECTRAVILQVNAEGEFTEWPCVAGDQDFLVALNAYREGKTLGKLAKNCEALALEGEALAA